MDSKKLIINNQYMLKSIFKKEERLYTYIGTQLIRSGRTYNQMFVFELTKEKCKKVKHSTPFPHSISYVKMRPVLENIREYDPNSDVGVLEINDLYEH
jgi:hypothetical protein